MQVSCVLGRRIAGSFSRLAIPLLPNPYVQGTVIASLMLRKLVSYPGKIISRAPCAQDRPHRTYATPA